MASAMKFMPGIEGGNNITQDACAFLREANVQHTGTPVEKGWTVKVPITSGQLVSKFGPNMEISCAWIAGHGELMIFQGDEGFYNHPKCQNINYFDNFDEMIELIKEIIEYTDEGVVAQEAAQEAHLPEG